MGELEKIPFKPILDLKYPRLVIDVVFTEITYENITFVQECGRDSYMATMDAFSLRYGDRTEMNPQIPVSIFIAHNYTVKNMEEVRKAEHEDPDELFGFEEYDRS